LTNWRCSLAARLGFEFVDQIDVEEPPAATPRAVIAWERYMRKVERVAASTIRRRLAALSSL
jgi:hypothetical protein